MIFKWNNHTIEVHKFYVWIAAITFLKIILMGTFSSDYENKMFIPFVNTFFEQIGTKEWNPYNYYFINNLTPSFPYPPIMLFIESIGGIWLYIFPNMPIFFINLIFKIPNLVFDFLGLYLLVNLFPSKRKYVAVLYFSSPIILYAVYMHGQLDIIPMILLVASIYYLVSSKYNNILISALLLALALGSKLHILAILPVICIFLLRRDGIKKMIEFCFIAFVGLLVIILPFWCKGFTQYVLLNSEQSVLTKIYFSFGDVKIYLPIIAVAIIYFIAFSMNIINKELLMSFCGLLFAVFLGLCPPMPGWYVWIVPFVTLFFINLNESKYKTIAIYLSLNGLYLIYFVLFHQKDYVDLYYFNKDLSYLKINNEMLSNICFTLLVGTLTYTIFLMFRLGVVSNSLYKRRNLPFTIGVAGDSGTGKSTLIDSLEQALGKNNLLLIEGDGDHRWERGEKEWDEYTHLNPKANYIYRQAEDMRILRNGSAVKRVEYDHETGRFTEARKIKPKKYILLCGLHSLYLPQMRKNMDLMIYMDTDETLRRYWKIQRDIGHRGYLTEGILKQIDDRMLDAVKYIYPQRGYADIVIKYFDKNLMDCCVDNYKVSISLGITLSAAVNIEPIIRELELCDLHADYDYSDDLRYQTLMFDGEELIKSKIQFTKIALLNIPQLDEITRETFDNADNIHGLIKLFVVSVISHKMQGEI